MELTPMCLRVENSDGRTVAEYRIRDEEVEVRYLPLSTDDEEEWYRLTTEDNETLWNCVNRICDKYMPTLRPEEFTHQGNMNVHLSRDSRT